VKSNNNAHSGAEIKPPAGAVKGAKSKKTVTRRGADTPEPLGWDKFDALAKALVRVPKEEVEHELAKAKRKRGRSKKKKK